MLTKAIAASKAAAGRRPPRGPHASGAPIAWSL